MACFHPDGTPYARFIPPPRPACVANHHMPTSWKSAGFDLRGYEKLICVYCFRFIGYRAPPSKHAQAKESTEALETEDGS